MWESSPLNLCPPSLLTNYEPVEIFWYRFCVLASSIGNVYDGEKKQHKNKPKRIVGFMFPFEEYYLHQNELPVIE